MTEWRKAGESPRPMMARAAAEIQPFAQVVGDIPDEHVITVAERRVSVDYPTIIQNNMNTDTVDLVLDGEWDGMSVVCYIGHPGDLAEFEWEGEPFTLPVYDATGSIDVTVVGLSADGKTRLVTVEAKGVMNVIKSGEFEGSVPPEDQPDLLGQILAAKGEAEDAAEAANTAATSATSAATKANQAASSANSAASSANSAATRATSAAVNAENAYDTLQPYMATIDSCANILHRKVGPDAVVTADDSFPCKPVEMVVYGNTVQNLWVNPSAYTQGGVTLNPNHDGSMSISGTSTTRVAINKENIMVLKPSTTYTLSVDKQTPSGARFRVGVNYDEGTYIEADAEVGGYTFKTPSVVYRAVFQLSVDSGVTLSGTYRVMLNEGSEPEPWCPPGLNSVGDGGSVEVVTAGKNLFNAASGDSINVGADGAITLENDFTLASFYSQIINIPKGTKVTLSKSVALGGACGPGVWLYHGTNTPDNRAEFAAYGPTNEYTYTTTRDYDHIVCFINGGNVTANTPFYVQLELGSTATAYEPPNITTTPIDLQGHTLNALPDGTRDELHIDGGGNVVLEKRTGTYIANGDEGWELSATSDVPYRMCVNDWSGNVKNKLLPINQFQADRLPKYSSTLKSGSTFVVVNGAYQLYAARYGIQDVSAFSEWLESNPMTVIYPLAEPQTIDLGTITPPTMAAPNVTAYVADDTPAEMSLDYVRDVNIAYAELEAKISALTVAQATS